jgi:hypothetical protein
MANHHFGVTCYKKHGSLYLVAYDKGGYRYELDGKRWRRCPKGSERAKNAELSQSVGIRRR